MTSYLNELRSQILKKHKTLSYAMILRRCLYKETKKALIYSTNVQDMNLVILQYIFLRSYPSAVTVPQGVTKGCRLSWVTNSGLVYKPKCGGGGSGVSANEYSCTHMEAK